MKSTNLTFFQTPLAMPQGAAALRSPSQKGINHERDRCCEPDPLP